MFGSLIGGLLALACALFVLSLPLGSTGIGVTLRRWAGVCFLASLLPSLLIGLGREALGGRGTAGSSSFGSDLGCLAFAVLLSVLAFAVLEIRKRLRSSSRDAWSEYVSQKSSGKQPIIRREPPPPDDSLF